jgi:integrase
MKGLTQGRIFPRGNILWISYYLNGTEYRESAKTADEPEARRFLKNRLNETGAHKIGKAVFVTPKAQRILISELVDSLEADFTLRGILSPTNSCNLARVTRDFGTYRAMQLLPENIDSYITGRLAVGNKRASINRTLQLLGQAYKHGVTQKRFSDFDIPAITHLYEGDNVRQDIFTETEVAAVIENLPEDLQDFTRWCAAFGQRCGEAKLLTWEMVTGSELQIPGNICKNAKARAIPLDVLGLDEIIARRRKLQTVEVNGTAQMCPLIFHRGGRPIGNFSKAWKRATRLAKCPGRLFHSLRRFAVTNLIRSGVAIPAAKLWSGHESDSMIFRYGILNTDDMRREAVKVEAYRATARAAQPRVVQMANKS